MSQPQNLRADELQHPTPLPTLAAVPQTPASSDDVVGQVSIATPRLRAVDGGSAGHTVPATVRHAESMTEGALALRLQAITRLGVVSAPTTLTSLAAFTTVPAQAAEACEDHLEVQEAVADGRTLAAVPADEAAAVGEESTAVEQTPTLAAVPADDAGVPEAGRAGAGAPLVVGPAVPDAQAWASRLVQAVSEVLVGDRPISQLVRFTDEAVFTDLNRRVRLLGLTTTATSRGAKDRCAVRSIRVCAPARHVAEVAAHVRHGDRSRAIALRMELRRHRWVCTALELG